jgi:Tfp pilus assembly protein PilN
MPLLVLAAGLAAVTAAAVVLGMSASSAADEQQGQLEAVEAATAALPKPPAPAVSQDALVQERTNRLAALTAALDTRVPFDRVLREISYVLPEDAWLTGLRAATTASLAPAAGAPGASAPQAAPADGVTIQGATYSHDAVARVLVRLSAVPSLENVRLTSSARVEQQQEQAGTEKPKTKSKKKKPKTVVTFTVSASLKGGGS